MQTASQLFVPVRKNTGLFPVLAILVLVLVSLGGGILIFLNRPGFSPVQNSNSNNISVNPVTLPNKEPLNTNINNTADNSALNDNSILNATNNVKKTDSRPTPTPKKIVAPPPKHSTPPKKNDPNCIFNDNCR